MKFRKESRSGSNPGQLISTGRRYWLRLFSILSVCVNALIILTCSTIANAAVDVPNNEYVLFYGSDLLGSPTVVSDDKGRVLWFESNRPYGESTNRYSRDGKGFGDNAFEEADWRVGYTGHEADTNSGLIYMQARFYDPTIGRFYSNDPVGFIENNPMMFNRYAYANNNPYKYTDPNGEVAETAWDAANVAVGAVSLGYNLHQGNYGYAVVDALGLTYDVFATTIPFLPGGAGILLKSSRGIDRGTDVLNSAKSLEFGQANLKHSNFGLKLDGKIPESVPKNLSPGEIDDAIAAVETSLASRKAELKSFDAIGGENRTRRQHASRISAEERFLKQLEKARVR